MTILHKFLGPFGIAYVAYQNANTWENATPEDLEFYRLAKEYYWTADKGWVKCVRFSRGSLPLTSFQDAIQERIRPSTTISVEEVTVTLDQWADAVSITDRNKMEDGKVGLWSGMKFLDLKDRPSRTLLEP